MKYFVYCRKSTDDEDHQVLSIESQRTELEKRFFNRDDITVVDVYEEARTAKTPGRPIFNDMMKRIKQGEADGIIAWHPDRLPPLARREHPVDLAKGAHITRIARRPRDSAVTLPPLRGAQRDGHERRAGRHPEHAQGGDPAFVSRRRTQFCSRSGAPGPERP